MKEAPPGDSPLSGARRISEWLEFPVGLAGVLTTLFAAIREKPWILTLGIAVMVASVAWYLVRRAIVRRRRPRIALEPLERGGGAYLRGLLPFERGEKLLGRGRDASTLLTKLRSRECRFAYVSGDAGVGKTSLLRSAVLMEMQSSGYVVVYSPKAGSDPIAAAKEALRSEVPEAGIAADATLLSALRAADAARGKPLVIVWDQFEEFFIAHRTVRDRRPFLEEIGRAYLDADLSVRFVVSLRKEFVDDLRDLAEWIPQPLDDRFSHRVRNWDAPEAAAVLEAAAAHDDVPFADALRDAIVSDLVQAGEVRPVELQLVASRLAELRIYDIAAYNDVERARGVLESYVNEIIKPPNVPADEQRDRVARFVLRLLCADTADAKRPVGLTFEEIVERAAASIDDTRVPVRELAADCLERATRALLVIREDEERYNLRHDYLARPILDATAGAQTIEQRANRVLDHYLERERSDPRVTIPRRDLRLIRKFASPQRKGEPAATRLMKRSRRRHALEIAAAALLLLVLATALFPPRVDTHSTIFDLNEGRWLFSA
ncbi:MAG TPA: hypothetical protein VN181_07120, partial [Thermoanaerobaculia bacterium]|nr:hypothetical protein [Thermoanaerobaculia bacterium]